MIGLLCLVPIAIAIIILLLLAFFKLLKILILLIILLVIAGLIYIGLYGMPEFASDVIRLAVVGGIF